MIRLKSISWEMAAGICMCWLSPFVANAATYTVTSTADGTALNQLRGAILDADTHGGTNTINVAAGTYILTMGEITFGNQAETITIVGTSGAGSTFIQMSGTVNTDRIFLINPPGTVSGVNVSIQGITFENGFLTSDGFGGGAILCGGPSNTTTLTNCNFLSNSNASGNGNGGALAMEGGGTFTITGCTFSNNTCNGGNGGAVFYILQNGLSGSLNINKSTFTSNQTTGSGTFGGAMRIEVDGSGSGNTSAVSVAQNSFVSNRVNGSGSMGGAINIDNGFASGNTAFINFNRFYKNTGPIPDLVSNSASGAVDITNNWWGINGGPLITGDPHVALIGGTGTLTSSPWLELKTTAVSSFVCGGSGGSTEVVTAGFLTNSAGTSVAAANLGAFTGTAISFTSTNGTISGAQTTIQSGGTATANFTATITPSPPGTQILADVQAIVDSVPATDVVAELQVPIHAPSLATGPTSGSVTAAAGDLVITDASCNLICHVVPGGAAPVSGTVTGTVTVDGSVQTVNGTPYVVRHYDIVPASGASTATGTITLYFRQSDFDSYNLATGSGNRLPTGSGDATGRANLTITQYHGTGTAPGNYTGWSGAGPANVMITPGASNVFWNASTNWWEVTFNVTGFSGFFVTGPVGISLPVKLESFSGQVLSGGVMLRWGVGVEQGMSSYEVDGSTDGVAFTALGNVVASGASGYQYFDARAAAGDHFYRLKMVNIDGTYSFSNVVLVKIATDAGSAVQVLGNPVGAVCMLRIVAASAGPVSLRLADMSGKTLWQGTAVLGPGANTIALPGMDRFAQGLYLLSVKGRQVEATVKVVKE